MASLSSLSVVSESKYDIFVSFRGVDTRRGFLSHLIKALNQKQIEIYVDYKLREGTQISHSLLTAIEESEISLIIFSQDYASSKWCLDELVKIMKCRKEKGQTAIPIFYDVDPSCVRHQRGSYVDALSGHRKTSSAAQLLMLKEALNEAANLSGLHSSNFGSDAALIDEIVKRVLQRLNEKCQGDLQGLVGMYEPITELESLLCKE
ncbi:putative disease resistance protein At4g11170 isoform X1 [Arachis duranensis]|uniref:ADP-ribosyl cyclase/cyclic ADP-ribose hydrolase n=1 Tax=Arachis duranensis TaxID=130453 RepID=A0A6P5MHP6_ARADU|nr:putative disease resistance protein At4g11170 isoform X1 [Arachis duranensis]